MKKKGLILLWIGFIVFSSLVISQADDQELAKIREAIKSKGAKWQADETSISRLPPEQRRALLGGPLRKVHPDTVRQEVTLTTLPSHFDWRDHNGYNWMTIIRDQPCSNCWAYAAVGAFEAMIKIESNRPNIPVDLSEPFVTWCGKGECTGWWMDTTLGVLRSSGVPDNQCLVSSICADTCEDRFFRSAFVSTFQCLDPEVSFLKDKIYNNGPMVAWMMIYSDFYSYSSGVYQYTWGLEEGGHFVVICGWDDTENYWICKNSWGTGWGETGWFRIRMGTNEAGIEQWDCHMNVDLASVEERMGVRTPDGGEEYLAEEICWVEWASPFFYEDVKIEYSTNSGSTWQTIVENTSNDGAYEWFLPELSSFNCRVKVSDPVDDVPSDQSDSDFTIFLLGDANGDSNVDIVDIVYLINYVLKSGPEPTPLKAGDAFCEDEVNIQDAVFLVNYVLKDGPKPRC